MRMFRDRLEQHWESKLEARCQVGALLDVNHATMPTGSRMPNGGRARGRRRRGSWSQGVPGAAAGERRSFDEWEEIAVPRVQRDVVRENGIDRPGDRPNKGILSFIAHAHPAALTSGSGRTGHVHWRRRRQDATSSLGAEDHGCVSGRSVNGSLLVRAQDPTRPR